MTWFISEECSVRTWRSTWWQTSRVEVIARCKAQMFRSFAIQLKWLPSNKLQYIRIAEKIFKPIGFPRVCSGFRSVVSPWFYHSSISVSNKQVLRVGSAPASIVRTAYRIEQSSQKPVRFWQYRYPNPGRYQCPEPIPNFLLMIWWVPDV